MSAWRSTFLGKRLIVRQELLERCQGLFKFIRIQLAVSVLIKSLEYKTQRADTDPPALTELELELQVDLLARNVETDSVKMAHA